MPDFASEFESRYREYWGLGIKEPFDVYYKTEIGKIGQAWNFGLKDSVTHVVQLQNFLISCKGPEDVFAETIYNSNFSKKYSDVKGKYESLILKARECVFGNLIFFDYAGDLSISADISNELSYLFKDMYISVAYKKGVVTNISLRGKNVREILEKVLNDLEDASGGGHEDAVGARIKTEDLGKFKERLKSELEGYEG